MQKGTLSGSLSDLNDRDIYNGPFRLNLTDNPALHLRFDNEEQHKDRPTIYILDTRTIGLLGLLDITGFMAYYPLQASSRLIQVTAGCRPSSRNFSPRTRLSSALRNQRK